METNAVVRCDSVAGQGQGLEVVVVVDGKPIRFATGVPNSLSYALPRIDDVTPTMIPTNGGRVLALRGAELARVGEVYLSSDTNRLACSNVKNASFGRLECTAPAGSGEGWRVL